MVSKGIVYFTIQGGYITSIKPSHNSNNHQVYSAEVTPRQQERLEDLLATYSDSSNSGNYDLDIFEALTRHMKTIKAKKL